ncbi:putative membrane protein [Xanthobacter flavus]|uniref:Membrane protein n=1 Tax=Xanthobacter flavus TaxID=281 RepID=A0A9W6CMC4_XANFL|nr:DUF2254 domain-containing protein [Xanthobacter flavus]MDR6333794.1 putative membrane protein [Xanthobacter flavus]GLI20453.1 hypothetical protein XFLAVUS301_01270 [Xanthobacter flavus]
MVPPILSERVRFQLKRLAHRLWFWPSAYSLTAVAVVLAAAALPSGYALPDYLTFASDSLEPVLTVMASSMLAVVTFSLSAIVSVLAAAAQAATPRATTLLIEDAGLQRTLSVFVGAFLFSIVALVGSVGGVYSDAGRLLLFAATVVLIAVVVGTLLRWIDRVSRLGRMGEIIDRTEEATASALKDFARRPGLGATVRDGPAPAGYPVFASAIGYVQHMDMGQLSAALPEGVTCHLAVRPGAFMDPVRPLAIFDVSPDDVLAEALRRAITIGDIRSFEQDPRFGMVVLAEIASKALSPGVNDPGTAIDVSGTLTRLLWGWRADLNQPVQDAVTNVTIPALSMDDMLEDAFRPIARDGAGQVEVGLRLVAALRSLAEMDEPRLAAAARARLADVLHRAEAVLLPVDAEALKRSAAACT